ncbi:MAG: transporter substrate-binding domain-containing protein [Lachnospiraceae bacterium]|nr:transporter substrate-binding domain-containing protein [Lachnospiraceae bacterium]
MKLFKNRFLTGVLLVSATAMLAGCGKSNAAGAGPSVTDDGVLVVGLAVGEDRSSFKSVDDDGNVIYDGIEPEVLAYYSSRYPDVQLQYVYANSNEELLTKLSAGEIELAAGGFTMLDSYKQEYVLSNSYGYGNLYLVNKKDTYIDSLTAYTDKNIGVMNSIPLSALSNIPGIDAVVQQNYDSRTVLADDIGGDVVAAGVCLERDAAYLLDTGKYSVSEISGGPQVSLCFLLPSGQSGFAGVLNSVIADYLDYKALGTLDQQMSQSE